MTLAARVAAPRYEPPATGDARPRGAASEVQAQILPMEEAGPPMERRSTRFKLILRYYPCQDGSSPHCEKEMPYKGGRPPRICGPCKARRSATLAEQATANAKARRRERAEAAETTTAQLHAAAEIVEFLRRPGVASLGVQFGFHKVFVNDRLFEGHTLEEAVAKAQAATMPPARDTHDDEDDR